jgi:hypothetical protein
MAGEEQVIEVPGTDIVPAATPQTIFKTDDPMEIMQRTTEVAEALKQFIAAQGLVSRISGRDYIVVEGWQMLGMMLGVTPVVTATRQTDEGWEAIVELHDRSGRVVGAGEAECLATERTWKNRDDYARRSMAQTRAIGKAFRNTFGFIAKAAGFEATPAEEMPAEQSSQTRNGNSRVSAPAAKRTERVATAKQRGLINARAAEKALSPGTLADIVRAAVGQGPGTFDSQTGAEEWLKRNLDRLPGRLVDAVLEGIATAESEGE